MAGLLLLGAGYFLWRYNPATATFFPPCPFLRFTGLLCPGCGSQRALHQLLHLNIGAAWHYNPLLVAALPYVAAAFIVERLPARAHIQRWRRCFFGTPAIAFILTVTLSFWILRNIL